MCIDAHGSHVCVCVCVILFAFFITMFISAWFAQCCLTEQRTSSKEKRSKGPSDNLPFSGEALPGSTMLSDRYKTIFKNMCHKCWRTNISCLALKLLRTQVWWRLGVTTSRYHTRPNTNTTCCKYIATTWDRNTWSRSWHSKLGLLNPCKNELSGAWRITWVVLLMNVAKIFKFQELFRGKAKTCNSGIWRDLLRSSPLM